MEYPEAGPEKQVKPGGASPWRAANLRFGDRPAVHGRARNCWTKAGTAPADRSDPRGRAERVEQAGDGQAVQPRPGVTPLPPLRVFRPPGHRRVGPSKDFNKATPSLSRREPVGVLPLLCPFAPRWLLLPTIAGKKSGATARGYRDRGYLAAVWNFLPPSRSACRVTLSAGADAGVASVGRNGTRAGVRRCLVI